MDGLTQIAAHLTSARVTLVESNAEHRSVEERRFEELLLAYIKNEDRRFVFGGVHNLLASVARACESLSQLEDDEYEQAAQLIDDCSDACDLKYPVVQS